MSKSLYANSTFINLLCEKEIGKITSVLFGLEYQNLYSELIFNGKLVNINYEKNYYAKGKYHFYILPSKENKISNLNGLYLGTSLKIGGAKADKFNYLTISPGIFLGYCLVISQKISINIEFDIDGYIDWQDEKNSNKRYTFEGYVGTWRNLWLSIAYKF